MSHGSAGSPTLSGCAAWLSRAGDGPSWALVCAKFGAKDIIREVQVLTHLYLTMRPDKAGDVDGLLREWEGEERLLLAKVRAKQRQVDPI